METKIQSIFPGAQTNVGTGERIVSMLSGTFLMLNALQKGKSLQGLAAGYLLFRGITGYCSTYNAIGKKGISKPQNVNIRTNLTIHRPVNEVYEFWRKLDRLPLFMSHLQSVTVLDEKTSEWKAKLPGAPGTITWKSEIVEDSINDRIGWRSLPGSTIEHAGNVHFRDAGRFGTNVYATISYQAPGGVAGEAIGRLLNPAFEKLVTDDIKNFKAFLEREIPEVHT